jgi:APA family basic amino acid/polyamine antiporter
VLSGEAAAKYAGPAVILSFILAAIVAGLAAFSYAEMASMVPISGSAYSYTYASMLERLFLFNFNIFSSILFFV